MNNAELVLEELNRVSLYPWVMQRRYGDVEYRITVAVPYGSYGGFYALPEAQINRVKDIRCLAADIFEAVARDFGIHYLRLPNVPDRFPSAQRALASAAPALAGRR